MTWQFLMALILAVPVILFPIALIWFLDIGGIITLLKQSRKRRAFQRGREEIFTVEQQADL